MTQRFRMFPDILADADRAAQETLARRQWGHWRLLTKKWELAFEESPNRFRYFIDLERCPTSAALLDWIFQVAHKTWATPKDTGDLIRALRDIFDPQSRLCSWSASRGGDGRSLDCAAFLRSRYGDGNSAQ